MGGPFSTRSTDLHTLWTSDSKSSMRTHASMHTRPRTHSPVVVLFLLLLLLYESHSTLQQSELMKVRRNWECAGPLCWRIFPACGLNKRKQIPNGKRTRKMKHNGKRTHAHALSHAHMHDMRTDAAHTTQTQTRAHTCSS